MIACPSITFSGGLNFEVYTSDTSGTIFTKHFGSKFDDGKVETDIGYWVRIIPPKSVKTNFNVTLHFEIDKILMEDLPLGQKDAFNTPSDGYVQTNGEFMSRNYTPPGHSQFVELIRKVAVASVKKQNMDLMPGFKLTWYYSGQNVVAEDTYYSNNNNVLTTSFVRY